MAKMSKAERRKLDRWHKKRKEKLRKRYPEIHGKKLDYVTQSYEDNDGGGWLYINLYFTDGTNFSMDFSLNNPAIVPVSHRVRRREHRGLPEYPHLLLQGGEPMKEEIDDPGVLRREISAMLNRVTDRGVSDFLPMVDRTNFSQ